MLLIILYVVDNIINYVYHTWSLRMDEKTSTSIRKALHADFVVDVSLVMHMKAQH